MLVRACETNSNLEPNGLQHNVSDGILHLCRWNNKVIMSLDQRSFTCVEAVYINNCQDPASRVTVPPPQLWSDIDGNYSASHIRTFDVPILLFIFIIDGIVYLAIRSIKHPGPPLFVIIWPQKKKKLEVFGAQSRFTQHSSVSLPRSFP